MPPCWRVADVMSLSDTLLLFVLLALLLLFMPIWLYLKTANFSWVCLGTPAVRLGVSSNPVFLSPPTSLLPFLPTPCHYFLCHLFLPRLQYLLEAKKAQQTLEVSYKQLDSVSGVLLDRKPPSPSLRLVNLSRLPRLRVNHGYIYLKALCYHAILVSSREIHEHEWLCAGLRMPLVFSVACVSVYGRGRQPFVNGQFWLEMGCW